MTLIEKIRARCDELHDLETCEAEEVYEQVAEEFGIEIDELYDMLDAEETE